MKTTKANFLAPITGSNERVESLLMYKQASQVDPVVEALGSVPESRKIWWKGEIATHSQ